MGQTTNGIASGQMKIVSLFSGCGGLDLGFVNAGFEVSSANDNDRAVWATYERNHNVRIDKRSILGVDSDEIPEACGIIGGLPCQSWSLAGQMRGINDTRGLTVTEYLRVISDKRPLFFVIENVPGIISRTHFPQFQKMIQALSAMDYEVNFSILNAYN